MVDLEPAVPAVGRIRAVGGGPERDRRRCPGAARRRRARAGVDLPARVEPRRRAAFRLRQDGLVEPVSRGRRGGAGDLPDGCRVRLAAMGVRALLVRVPRRRPHRLHLEPRRHAARRRAGPAVRRADGPGSALRRDRLPVDRRRGSDDRVHRWERRDAPAGGAPGLPRPIGRRAEGERGDHRRRRVPVGSARHRVPDGGRSDGPRLLLPAGERGVRRTTRASCRR